MKVPQLLLCSLSFCPAVPGAELPGAYFTLLEAGSAKVEKRLAEEPGADLAALESRPGWRHFPYAILAPAVLYSQNHPANRRYHDPVMLNLAARIGDLMAGENEKGRYEPRLDSDWDTYMWIEACRLLEPDLGKERQARWKREILKNVALLVPGTVERLDFPWYHSPFIGTSPNHYSQWASILHFAAKVFGNPEWEQLGARVLRRFAMVEQSSDGYWGEHNNSGPTPGYNHLTLTALALYYEHSKDPEVLPALRKATDFHINCTYPRRNRRGATQRSEPLLGSQRLGTVCVHEFSGWPPLRGISDGLLPTRTTAGRRLGRLAQDALYYHGPDEAHSAGSAELSAYRMNVSGGNSQDRPVDGCLSGIMSTQAVNSQFYLDRQVLHQHLPRAARSDRQRRELEAAARTGDLFGKTPRPDCAHAGQHAPADERCTGPALARLQHILQRTSTCRTFGSTNSPCVSRSRERETRPRTRAHVATLPEAGRAARNRRRQESRSVPNARTRRPMTSAARFAITGGR